MLGGRRSLGELAFQDSWRDTRPPRLLRSTSIALDYGHGTRRAAVMVTMSVDRRKAAVFAAAVALRVLLFCGFPSLPDLLTGRVEVSTPVSSFKRCELDDKYLCSCR